MQGGTDAATEGATGKPLIGDREIKRTDFIPKWARNPEPGDEILHDFTCNGAVPDDEPSEEPGPLVLCGECKHWDTKRDQSGILEHMGIETTQKIGVCRKAKQFNINPEPFVLVEYGYDLLTGPTFGCVLGEKK